MNNENNILTSNGSREENIIKHPQEAYAEVSTRSILKIRSYADKAKHKARRTLCTISMSIWTTCLGALLGYLPEIIAMFKESSFSDFSSIYILVSLIGVASFITWRVLCNKNSITETDLIKAIEEELSEERIPINKTTIRTDRYSLNNVELNPVIEESPNAETALLP